MKQNGNMTQAMDLYVQGMAQKDIAGVLGVSEQTVSVWKGSCRGTAWDWDNRKRQTGERKQAFPSWIEEKIDHTMKEIDNAIREGIPEEDLLKRLDAFITMKRKYDAGIDKLGETARVMEAFILFVKEHHKDVKNIVKDVITSYLRQVGK